MAANDWNLTENGLKKVVVFTTFSELTRFLVLVGPEADARDHHPDLRVFRATHLEIHLITHDAGTVTDKDYALAEVIDRIVEEFGS